MAVLVIRLLAIIAILCGVLAGADDYYTCGSCAHPDPDCANSCGGPASTVCGGDKDYVWECLTPTFGRAYCCCATLEGCGRPMAAYMYFVIFSITITFG